MGDYAVIGLGRFGSSVAHELTSLGHTVLAIDKNEQAVAHVATHVARAVQIDATDPEALRQVGITNFETVIVAIGVDTQESILTTLILKELKVPRVVAKAVNELQAKVLERVGADLVVRPERDMGIRLAHMLGSANVLDYLELTPEIGVEEVRVPEKLSGQTLRNLALRTRFGVSVLLIRRGADLIISPGADTSLRVGDVLIVVGPNRQLTRLEELLR
ncbi:MAG: TrkA family potassium uptake protein [Armatimonadetes bacterium]|nr:TrkA family potassium uptake protein [Armatimonadota bacterium]